MGTFALAEVSTDTVIGSTDDLKEDSISRRGVLTREKEEILWGLVESADAGLGGTKFAACCRTQWHCGTLACGTLSQSLCLKRKGGDTMGTSGERGCRTRRDEVRSLLQDAMALWNTLAVLVPHRFLPTPLRQSVCQISPQRRDEVRVEHSRSPCASPIVLPTPLRQSVCQISPQRRDEVRALVIYKRDLCKVIRASMLI